MPTRTKHYSFDVYTIVCKRSGARADLVPALGGIVSSLQLPRGDQLHELLYQQEWFWDPKASRTRGGIPFLFPICGRLERDGVEGAYLCNYTRYQLPIHGFAMRMPWHVLDDSAPDALSLEFTDTDETRAVYPFEFRLQLTWRISADRLVCTQEYLNTGDEPLPYYAGFHPYFLTPPPGAGKDAVQLTYTAQRRLLYNERLTDIAGTAAPPRAPIAITAPEINEALLTVPDGSAACLRFPDGYTLEVSARGLETAGLFPFMQFYTMPDKPFFCIEPWMSFPNAMNSMQGVRWLAPGARDRARLECRLLPPSQA